MEEVETDHAVIFECCHEAEDRRKILSVSVHNRRKRKRNLQYMGMGKEVTSEQSDN